MLWSTGHRSFSSPMSAKSNQDNCKSWLKRMWNILDIKHEGTLFTEPSNTEMERELLALIRVNGILMCSVVQYLITSFVPFYSVPAFHCLFVPLLLLKNLHRLCQNCVGKYKIRTEEICTEILSREIRCGHKGNTECFPVEWRAGWC